MREAELERRLAFCFLIVEQPVEHSQQIVIAPCMEGGSANLRDMLGEGTWRIGCDLGEFEQGPVTAHIAFQRETEKAFERIGSDQRLALGSVFPNSSREDRDDRLRHGSTQRCTPNELVDRVAEGLRIACRIEGVNQEIMQARAFRGRGRTDHVGENVEERCCIEFISVSEDFIHAAEIVDRDRLVASQTQLKKIKRAHAEECAGGRATIDNRLLSRSGTIARQADRQSRWHWRSR